MGKNRALKVVNPLMLLLLVVQATSGLLNERLGGELFEKIHVPGGLLLVALALTHLTLNWSWVQANFFSPSKPAAPPSADQT